MQSPKVLGVLVGRDLAPGALATALIWADIVVAADAGADLCRAAGREPDAIVGDLDSISDASGLTADPDQDTSDADKLLAYFEAHGYLTPKVIGVEGDRLDHVLGTLFSCVRRPLVRAELLLRRGTALVLSADGRFDGEAVGRVSILPLARSVVTATGLRWPLERSVLEASGLVSLSNEMVGDRLSVTVHEGAVALFIGP